MHNTQTDNKNLWFITKLYLTHVTGEDECNRQKKKKKTTYRNQSSQIMYSHKNLFGWKNLKEEVLFIFSNPPGFDEKFVW